MSTPQPSPELTTRDVLQQIDHRLSLIEMDVRENHTKIEAKIDALDSKFEAKIDAFDRKFEGKIDALDSKVEDKFNAFNNKFEGRIDALDNKVEGKIEVEIRELRREFNGKFNLVIGLVITSWLSMMGTMLFKL